MQFPACDLTLHMIVHSNERPDGCTVRGLCLVSADVDSATILVNGAVAAMFAVSVGYFCLCCLLLESI